MSATIRSSSKVSRGFVSILVLSATCATAFVRGGGEEARPAIDPALFFPSGTPLVLALDGLPCSQHAEDLAISKIWREPEMQEFFARGIELAREQIDNSLKGVAEQLGLTVEELLEVAKSRFLLGVTRFELTEGFASAPSLDLMLAVEVRSGRKGVEALVKMLEAQFGAGGGEAGAKDATIGGVPARTLSAPPGSAFESVTWLFHEGWLLAATSTAQLEAAVTRAKSGDATDSLASNGFFTAGVKEVVRPKTVAWLHLDWGFMLQIIGSLETGDDDPVDVLGASMLESLKAVSFGIDLDGAYVRERVFAQMTPNSVLARLQPPIDLGGILGRIPRGATAAYVASLDVKAYFDFFEKTFADIPAIGNKIDEGLAEAERFLGPGWRESLLGNLGPEVGGFLVPPEYGIVPDIGVLIRVRDRAAFEGAVAQITARPRVKAVHKTAAYGGHTIHYFDLGAAGIDRDLAMRPAYVLMDDYLLLAPAPHSAKGILHALAAQDGGFTAREDFAATYGRLKSESPDAGNLGVMYLDARWLAGFLLDNSLPIVQSTVSPDHLEEMDVPFELDLGKLPSTESVTKHLSAIVSQNQTKTGGAYTESVSPFGTVGGMVLLGGIFGAVGLRVAGEEAEMEPPIGEPRDEDEDR